MVGVANPSEPELLTKREVAELLRVSEVTVARWLKQGRLPAYRVGPRAVRVRREDVERLLTPIAATGDVRMAEPADPDWRERALRPLTPEEVERGLKAMREAFALSDAIMARRGGKPFTPSSAEIIRREREKRSRQIDEAIWGHRRDRPSRGRPIGGAPDDEG
jgi:excisionase family DNA binding protein